MTLQFPILGLELSWPLLIAIGFISGTIGALFGVGGGIVTTSFLNIAGAPMPLAVGTSAWVIAGSAGATTLRNRKLRNIEWRAGTWLALFMIPTVEFSARIMRTVQASNPDGLDPWLRALFIGTVMLTTAIWWFKKEGVGANDSFWSRIPLRPWVRIGGEQRVSLWVLAGSGSLAGFLAGFLGLGGGRVIMPVLIGVLNLGIKRAVGTSSLVILLSAIYSSITYSSKGLTDFHAVALLLGGSLAGAWFGNAAMHDIPQLWLRLLYLCLSLNTLLSLALKQAGLNSPARWVLIVGCLMIATTAYLRQTFAKTQPVALC